MKYKVLSHEFSNTGGNCMVDIAEVWLTEVNKTVYVYTNEECCSIYSVDYIGNSLEVDDYDEITIDSINYRELITVQLINNIYYELYRDCLNNFAKEYFNKYKICIYLPFVLLTDDLQKQITLDYRRWHEENVSRLYKTEGEHVILDGSYLQNEESQEEKEKLTFALWQLKHAHKQLLEAWQEARYIDLNQLKANDKYPFYHSFDELEVADWVDSVVDELFKNK